MRADQLTSELKWEIESVSNYWISIASAFAKALVEATSKDDQVLVDRSSSLEINLPVGMCL